MKRLFMVKMHMEIQVHQVLLILMEILDSMVDIIKNTEKH